MNSKDKPSTVEIKPDTRITEKDRNFCVIYQKAYDAVKVDLDCIQKQWNNLIKNQEDIFSVSTESNFDKFRFMPTYEFSTEEISGKIEYLPKIFIETIVNYFNETYHVSIDSDEVERTFLPKKPLRTWKKRKMEEYYKTMLELSLRYEDILEQIFVQIEGRTFEEQAVYELKEKCRQFVWNSYTNTKDYKIKDDTIQFNGYACSYYAWSREQKWNISDGMKDILRGVSHFETGQLESYPNEISDLLDWDEKEASTYEFSLTKVKQLRLFKNHRVDIKFSSKEYAERFASEYFGLLA